MLQLRRALVLLMATFFVFTGVHASGQAYTSIVVFGDSLSDVGNDSNASLGIYGPSAQLPGPASNYTNGRFTDGTDTVPAAHNYNGVWIEQLAARLAAKPPVVASTTPGGTGRDYAFGFAFMNGGSVPLTYGPGGALVIPVDGIEKQVSIYLGTSPVITNKTLFVIWGGANDLLNATTADAIAAAAVSEAALVQTLINAGATEILVPNLPPLGLTPRFNASAAPSATANLSATIFNQTLAKALAAIPAANPGKTLHIYQLDTNTLFNTVIGPPLYTGLANVTAGAQGVSTVNPDTYLFWDDLHPTTYGHSLIASAALTLLGTPVTTTTTLATSNVSPNPNASVTLTASVTAASGVPSGTVTFYDAGTVLGTAYTSGSTTTTTAALTTAFAVSGSHTITATFNGVNGYVNSNSSSLAEAVSTPALTFTPNNTSLLLAPGASATDVFTVNTVGGYSGTVSFACGTVPSNFTCSFSPTSLSVSGATATASTKLTITAGGSARLAIPVLPGESGSTSLLALLPFAGLAGLLAARRRLPRNFGLMLLAVMASGAALVGISGCSSSGSTAQATKGFYTVPVTATSNGTRYTSNITVLVQ